MPITLPALFEELDRHSGQVPLDELTTLMGRLRLTPECVAPFAKFSDERYCRNLIHEGPGYQALVLCWKAGQRSPIHDHRGSSCGVRVIQGELTETVFERARDGRLVARRSHRMSENQVCGSFDADIHQVSNLQASGEPLMTLHIYSPALITMGTYSLTDDRVREFEEPIDSVFEFCNGAGI
jgi:cysteine dioxygenase